MGSGVRRRQGRIREGYGNRPIGFTPYKERAENKRES